MTRPPRVRYPRAKSTRSCSSARVTRSVRLSRSRISASGLSIPRKRARKNWKSSVNWTRSGMWTSATRRIRLPVVNPPCTTDANVSQPSVAGGRWVAAHAPSHGLCGLFRYHCPWRIKRRDKAILFVKNVYCGTGTKFSKRGLTGVPFKPGKKISYGHTIPTALYKHKFFIERNRALIFSAKQ